MRVVKTITDPLYGTIGLSETEAKIVSSRTFQRLHNVRQLGLAHLVFPSAGYSRFAHSVGACRNAGRILEAICINTDKPFPDEYIAAYRIAALLHDVGHYPFSHTTEHALADFYAGSLLQGSDLRRGTDSAESINHEDVGKEILGGDPEIAKILNDAADIDVKMLSGIFSKNVPDPLFGVISSELDCDRLDYLGRTSYISGVPYGRVDVEFIINKATLGPDGELAFERKAAKAIDHLLVGRYYDYMQMVYHKTVEGLEWSLAEAINFALDEEHGLLSKEDVKARIADHTWWKVDDSWLIDRFKDLQARAAASAEMGVLRDHLSAVLYRQPPKRVWKWEAVKARTDKEVAVRRMAAEDAVRGVVQEMGLEADRFKVIERKFRLVKLSHNDFLTSDFAEEKARSIKIVGKRGTNFLVQDESLLLHSLSDMRNFAVTIYYLPKEGEPKTAREAVRQRLSDRLH